MTSPTASWYDENELAELDTEFSRLKIETRRHKMSIAMTVMDITSKQLKQAREAQEAEFKGSIVLGYSEPSQAPKPHLSDLVDHQEAERNRQRVANDYCGSFYTQQNHIADQWQDETKPAPSDLVLGSLPTIETARLHKRAEPSDDYGLTKREFYQYKNGTIGTVA